MKRAVFLDRDGVLIQDVHLLTKPEQIRILSDTPEALQLLRDAGFLLIIVTNQAVIARGLVTEEDVHSINQKIEEQLKARNGPVLDGFFVCPHHPNATLSGYRTVCDCRKPRAGLIFEAAQRLQVDLNRSFLVGDRITDVIAGARAGCRTILVETGRHLEPQIEATEPIDNSIRPDYICENLLTASQWILCAK